MSTLKPKGNQESIVLYQNIRVSCYAEYRANNKLQHELKAMNRDREKIEENFTSYYNPDPDPSSMPV